MGIVHSGVPQELVQHLQSKYKLGTFVETGTFHGDSAAWAASHFEQVITIELAKSIYEVAKEKHGDLPNIKFLFGDSRQLLREIVPNLTGSALFWLDGHWSGGDTYGENDECPLLTELAMINTSNYPPFILIDDARFFVAPPEKMLNLDQWPTLSQVIHALEAGKEPCYVVVFEDAIIAVPEFARQTLAAFCQERRTVQVILDFSPTRKGLALIRQGIPLVAKGLRVKMKRMFAQQL